MSCLRARQRWRSSAECFVQRCSWRLARRPLAWLARVGWYREQERSKKTRSFIFPRCRSYSCDGSIVLGYSRLVTSCSRRPSVRPFIRPSVCPHVHTCHHESIQLSHPRSAGILPTSALCPPPAHSCSLPSPVTASLCQGGTIVVVWTSASPPLPFLSSSPLCPCPCPPPLKP